RLALPQSFRHGQSETFPQRLLQDEGGCTLECIDRPVRICRQQQDVDIRIVPGGFADFAEHDLALRVVGGGPACQDELETGNERAREPVRPDDPGRILEAVEARYLDHHVTVWIDAEALA